MRAQVQILSMPWNESDTVNLESHSHDIGAEVRFLGWVRSQDHLQRALLGLEVFHYPEVTEAEIWRLIKLMGEKWPIILCSVWHRVGKLSVGEKIVELRIQAAHRQAAFEAANFLMDKLKTEVPFWKKEWLSDGQGVWVEAKVSDSVQAKRWEL